MHFGESGRRGSRSEANPDIIMAGTDTAFPGAWFDSGTSLQCQSAADQWALHIATGYKDMYWHPSQRMNSTC